MGQAGALKCIHRCYGWFIKRPGQPLALLLQRQGNSTIGWKVRFRNISSIPGIAKRYFPVLAEATTQIASQSPDTEHSRSWPVMIHRPILNGCNSCLPNHTIGSTVKYATPIDNSCTESSTALVKQTATRTCEAAYAALLSVP